MLFLLHDLGGVVNSLQSVVASQNLAISRASSALSEFSPQEGARLHSEMLAARTAAAESTEGFSSIITTLRWLVTEDREILPTPTNLLDLVRDSASKVPKPAARRKGPSISVSGVAAATSADEALIGRALVLLMTVLADLAEESRVEVEVRKTSSTSSILLRIVGLPFVPENEPDRVFLPFYSAATLQATTKRFGVDLFFAQQVAIAHGGQLRVRSTKLLDDSAKRHRTETVFELQF